MNRRWVWRLSACAVPLAAAMPQGCSPPTHIVAFSQPATLGVSKPAVPSTAASTTSRSAATTDATTAATTAATTLPDSQPYATRPHEPLPPLLSGIKEGTFLANRVGRLVFNAMGPYPYFSFWQDGKRVRVELLPDRNLMALEQAAFWNDRQLFDVSGRITNYNGHDYLLVERVTRVLPSSRPSTAATAESSTQP